MTRKKQKEEWGHDKLAEDLALAIKTPFLNIPLGSVWLGQTAAAHEKIEAIASATTPEEVKAAEAISGNSTQLADVIAVKPSYARFCLSIYEIKISRADFQSDVRSGKYKGYLDHCHRLYFATPAGMVTKEEIPPEAGWIVRGASGWKVMKIAPVLETKIPETTMMSIIFKKQHLSVRERHTKHLLQHYGDRKKSLGVIGKDLSEAWVNRDNYRRLVATYENMVEDFRQAVWDGLGVEREADGLEMVAVTRLVRDLKKNAATAGIEVRLRAMPRAAREEKGEDCEA